MRVAQERADALVALQPLFRDFQRLSRETVPHLQAEAERAEAEHARASDRHDEVGGKLKPSC